MKVTLDNLSTCKKKLTISLDAQTVADTRQKIIKDAYRVGSVPGFRVGKAPMSMFMKQYGDHIDKELKISLIRDSYNQAIEENKLNPLDRKGELDVKFLEDGSAEYQMELELEPEFELKAYRNMDVEYLKPESFTPERLEKEILAYRERMAEYQPCDIIDADSIAYLDIVHLDEQGNDIPETHRDKMVVMIRNNQLWPDELIRDLIGLNLNQEKQVAFTYPDRIKEYADQSVTARIKPIEIKHLVVPELNQEFIETKLQNEVVSVEEFKTKFEDELKSHLEKEAKEKRREGLIRQLLKSNPLDAPDSIVMNQFYHYLEQARSRFEYMPPEQQKSMQTYYFLKSVGDTKLHYILKKIELAEKIEITPDEVNQHLNELAEIQKKDAQTIKRELIQSGNFIPVKTQWLEEKIFDFLDRNNNWIEVDAYTQDEEEAEHVTEDLPVINPEPEQGSKGE